MKTRWLVMAIALFALVVLFVLFLFQRMRQQNVVLPHAIVLADGRQIDGILMELEKSSYLLQTGSESIIVPGGEIKSIDGTEIAQNDPPAVDRIPLRQEAFEDLSADGAIELHSTQYYRNDGTKILDAITWGLAPHELDQLETYRILDEFGNDLPLSIGEGGADGGKRIRVDLPRPILPGETLRLTTIFREDHGVRRDGEIWVYRNVGNYPDNRLVTRSVRLPAGAEIVDVDPEPLHLLDSQGRPLIIWRRHFLRQESIPWEIRYRL